MTKSPFRYFKTSPEIIQLAVMMYVRFPLSLRNVEDLLHERGIDICHETVRHWVDRFGTLRSLQKFVSVHSSVYNHFNLERHINTRIRFKQKRDAALREWRDLLVA